MAANNERKSVGADGGLGQAVLVESIPTGMDDLRVTQGVGYTGAVLKRLTDSACKSIDLTAMYWALRPNPARRDEQGFRETQLLDEFGGQEGKALYEALAGAAARGVKIRIIQSPGFDPTDDESGTLCEMYADAIEVRKINMADWYSSGIMHQKIWIFDGKSVYLGSANMDWKSLTQVKEMGIAVEDHPAVASDLSRYFDAWWTFTGLPAQERVTRQVFDPTVHTERIVPAWSGLDPPEHPVENPLDGSKGEPASSWGNPIRFDVDPGPATGNDTQSPSALVSGAPRELCAGGRVFDGDVLVQTILDAKSSVCICVMDFAPVSLYRGTYCKDSKKCCMIGADGAPEVATPVWWPDLVDAVLHAVTTNAVHVRLLVSEWAHTSDFITPYLQALQAAANAGGVNRLLRTGKLEIRRFRVPGWKHTDDRAGRLRTYPGHTRVNHAKYIVTDRRMNIGTSNMTYDYFADTAGASFNTDHPGLVNKLQEVFDRDWDSEYSLPQT